jgi:hypothetical protein
VADLHLPDPFIGVAFNAEPFDPAAVPVWSDLSSRCVSIGSASRGRQYELDQNQTGAMDVSWVNIDEALNPANAGSPYSPNVQPYRQILARCMWPNGGTGNLLNLAYWGNDPTFESYALGPAPTWLVNGSFLGASITLTNPFQGVKSVTYTVLSGGGTATIGWVVPCIPGRQYTASAYVRQAAANVTQIQVLGSTVGSNTVTTGAYVRLSVTFTATQPTHTVQVSTITPGLTGAVNIDAIQLDPGAAATTFTTTGPLIRNIWTRGYVERWPVQWDETGFEGQSTTPCVGPFAILQNAGLHVEVRLSILAKAPRYYWPLVEVAGAQQFGEASGNAGPALLPLRSKYGPGAGITSGVETAIVGAPDGVGVQLTRDTTQSAFSGKQQSTLLSVGHAGSQQLLAPLPATPLTSWAGTWSAWVNCTDVGDYAIIFTNLNPVKSSGSTIFVLTVLATSGFLEYKMQGTAGTAFATTATSIADGRWHHVVVLASQVSGGNTVSQIYVDGSLAATNTVTTASIGLPTTSAVCLQIGGYTKLDSAVSEAWSGTVTHVAGWYRTLTPAEIADLWQAGLGYAGELEGARIARYVAGAGYAGPTAISAGASFLSEATVKEDAPALGAIQHVADSTFGNFYESGEGIGYDSRFARYLRRTSSYTFGENVAGGEYPYDGDVLFDFDPTYVYNIADVTRTGGIVAHAEANDGGLSRKRFGPKPFARTVDLASDNEAVDAATYTLAVGSVARQRVGAITFDPAAVRVPFGDGTLWPMVLTIEIGTRVTVKRRPKSANAGAGITMSGDYFVESVSHHDINWEAGTWKTTLLLSPVPVGASPWILEDAVYGQLDATTVLGF